jgi:hypothetical protein
MSVSDFAENKLLDATLRNVSFAAGAAVYVKLHTGDPGEAGTANAAGNTTRQAATFAAASGGVSASNADVTWTNVSTSETYAYVSLWDASTAGNCLWTGPLSASKAVTAGDTFSILSGNLTVTLD